MTVADGLALPGGLAANQLEIVEAFTPVLLKLCGLRLEEVLLAPGVYECYGVDVNMTELAAEAVHLAEGLIRAPRGVLRSMTVALQRAQEEILEHHPQRASMARKDNVQVRPHGLPYYLDPSDPTLHPGISGIRSVHVGKLVTILGTVARTGAIQMLEAGRLYECTRCNHAFIVDADLESGGVLPIPTACPNHTDAPCAGKSFRHRMDVPLHADFQEVRLKERLSIPSVGANTRSLTIYALGDLADRCRPGDDIEATGLVVRRWRSLQPGTRCEVELVVHAMHIDVLTGRRGAVEVGPRDAEAFEGFWAAHRGGAPGRDGAWGELAGRNKILLGVCPQVHGMFTVKLATMLALIGGVSRKADRAAGAGTAAQGGQAAQANKGGAGPNVRGEVHMLLVGDPGTGKSQFLKAAARLAPRSVVTSGKGTSSAGLTASAVKDANGWALEAGALVLANGGVCCIDEFGCLKPGDRTAIHEAMEQQTLSIAKAGVVSQLQTCTTVFGVMNPKSKTYDSSLPLTEVTGLSGPLLSRFDVILVLLDQRAPRWDETVSAHVLRAHQAAVPADEAEERAATRRRTARSGEDDGAEAAVGAGGGWSPETIRKYVAWVRAAFEPVMGADARGLLMDYFQAQRQWAHREAARTTVRMLESLVRLSQAHARLMARREVTRQDAVMAIVVAESAAATSRLLGNTAVLQGGFPEDPDAMYAGMEESLLRALQFENPSAGCGVLGVHPQGEGADGRWDDGEGWE
ncbi:unnamed protein product [Pedinophyceae sp. YPF-701]|nr:unnamed protein product [Pedinophyceae sp. YPF-701]